MATTTLLFSDIEASTRLLTVLGDLYPSVLSDHRRVVRDAVAAAGGTEIDTQGDAFSLLSTMPKPQLYALSRFSGS